MKTKITVVICIALILTPVSTSFGQGVNSSDQASASVDRPWYNHVKSFLWNVHPVLGELWAGLVNPFTDTQRSDKIVVGKE